MRTWASRMPERFASILAGTAGYVTLVDLRVPETVAYPLSVLVVLAVVGVAERHRLTRGQG